MNNERLNWDFEHHAPNSESVTAHEMVRSRARALAGFINDFVPDGREKSLAITKLEEVMFWANAAIARQDRPEEAQ